MTESISDIAETAQAGQFEFSQKIDDLTSSETDQSIARNDVAIVIVSWNVRHYLAACLRSVLDDLRKARLKGKVWLIDNNSTDGTVEFVQDFFPSVEIIANENNAGFGAANNQGIKSAEVDHPRYYFLLNPDTLVRPGSIGQMVRWLDDNADVGMVGPRLVYADGRLQHSGFELPGLKQLLFEFWPLPARLYNTRWNGRYPSHWYDEGYKPFQIGHPLGAAMMVRGEIALATGGFDETFHMYCEEIDWAWRIKNLGWKIMTVPSAEIVHYAGESTKQIAAQSVINLWQSRALLYRKYYQSWKIRTVNGIVRSGLRRQAGRADSADLQAAYLQASEFWQ